MEAKLAGEEQTEAQEKEGAEVEQRQDQARGDIKFDHYNSDSSRWVNKIDQQVRTYWAKMGPESCQIKTLRSLHRSNTISSKKKDFSQKLISNRNSAMRNGF